MPTRLDIQWTRGQTEEWTLTILQSDGTPDDLTDAMSVELEVKRYEETPDPAVLHLDQTSGITIRPQTSPNIGICDVEVSAAQTFALAAGTWYYDVFVTRTDDGRKRALFGKLSVIGVVNFL